MPEGADGIGQGGFEGLVAYREESSEYGGQAGHKKNPDRKRRFICELLEPFPHHKIGDGPRDQVGQDDQQHELFQEEPKNARDRRTHHLPDSDLLCP